MITVEMGLVEMIGFRGELMLVRNTRASSSSSGWCGELLTPPFKRLKVSSIRYSGNKVTTSSKGRNSSKITTNYNNKL